ncbi:MAG: hypothetical protein PHN89_05465 [Candidatus Pacebacteria bacterium]|nr:hypothetical protein [Candidatus Paceibacterota bacterium]MDD5222458.1 hypothetical protein [bacterium]
MTEKDFKDTLTRIKKLEESVEELTKNHNQVVLALIPFKAALEQMMEKGLIDAKELDKRANELLNEVKRKKAK